MKINKEKIVYKLKSNIFFIVLILGAVFNDLVLRALTVKKIFFWKPLVTTVGVILLMSIFVWFCKYKKRKYIFITLSAIFSLISSLNFVYYNYYSSFLSFSLFKQLKNIGDMKSSVFKTLDLRMLIFFIPTIVMVLMFRRLETREFFQKLGNISKKREFVIPLVTGILLLALVFTTLTSTDKSRIVKQWNRPYLVEQLGIYSFTTADIVKNISSGKIEKIDEDEITHLMENLKNENYASKIENEYTNILEGRDVYVIHYESAQTFPMDLEFADGPVTPFLNQLASQGLYFDNFHPQHSVGTSSDTEFSFNTSLLPINNGTVFITHADREYISMQQLLKEKGYYSFSMHGNNGDFWNRNVMHARLGYDRFYSKSDYDIDEEIGLGLSDMSFFNQSVDKIKEIKEANPGPIISTLITLTHHYPFNEVDKYGEFDVGYLEGTDTGNYLKSLHYADMALESFVQRMDEEGLLDNAVIVLYGDHHAKISKADYKKLYGEDEELEILEEGPKNVQNIQDNENLNTYPSDLTEEELEADEDLEVSFDLSEPLIRNLKRTPLIFWTKDGIVTDTVSTPMGMIDILPTLGNMLNIYNPYGLGKDIFNLESNQVVFPDGSWLNEDYYYSASSCKIYDIISEEEIEDPEGLAENKPLLDKIDISYKIIQNDLIRLYKGNMNIAPTERHFENLENLEIN